MPKIPTGSNPTPKERAEHEIGANWPPPKLVPLLRGGPAPDNAVTAGHALGGVRFSGSQSGKGRAQNGAPNFWAKWAPAWGQMPAKWDKWDPKEKAVSGSRRRPKTTKGQKKGPKWGQNPKKGQMGPKPSKLTTNGTKTGPGPKMGPKPARDQIPELNPLTSVPHGRTKKGHFAQKPETCPGGVTRRTVWHLPCGLTIGPTSGQYTTWPNPRTDGGGTTMCNHYGRGTHARVGLSAKVANACGQFKGN